MKKEKSDALPKKIKVLGQTVLIKQTEHEMYYLADGNKTTEPDACDHLAKLFGFGDYSLWYIARQKLRIGKPNGIDYTYNFTESQMRRVINWILKHPQLAYPELIADQGMSYITAKGITVGCTFVPFEQVELIYARMLSLREPNKGWDTLATKLSKTKKRK